jgi:hypothetical protein
MELVDKTEEAKPALPTAIDEVDALKLEKLSLERDLLQTQMQLLDSQRTRLSEMMKTQTDRGNAIGAALREKYQIGDHDRVDVGARKIERA